MLNFAPALANYKPELFECLDYLILNEVEIQQLLTQAFAERTETFRPDNDEDVKKACTSLLEKHASLNCVIVTLGENGVIYSERFSDQPVHVPIEKVKVVDSTVKNKA